VKVGTVSVFSAEVRHRSALLAEQARQRQQPEEPIDGEAYTEASMDVLVAKFLLPNHPGSINTRED
jgi:hypothetical protein